MDEHADWIRVEGAQLRMSPLILDRLEDLILADKSCNFKGATFWRRQLRGTGDIEAMKSQLPWLSTNWYFKQW